MYSAADIEFAWIWRFYVKALYLLFELKRDSSECLANTSGNGNNTCPSGLEQTLNAGRQKCDRAPRNANPMLILNELPAMGFPIVRGEGVSLAKNIKAT
ncbi:hypothetical protein K0M31_002669 [Melipona bicolor]|uniref:Uncharacterized protein n=1 Tax=Melipona bicolor TaxID=60889 RepID=A0AA40G025_9HYME|nr:hypothetical protein K0M31_002669 [Melipona bicolor]